MARQKHIRKTRILFINTEVDPYLPGRYLSDLGRILPQAMEDDGHEARIFTPKFSLVNERRNQLHEVIRLSGQNIVINEADHQLVLKVASLMPQRIQVYFIESEDYFSSRKIYGEQDGHEYPDQMERCLFFVRGITESLKRLRWMPDIIYCQGWFAALAPLLFKKANECSNFRSAKIVYALFDHGFEYAWPASTSRIVKIPGVTKADIAEIKDKPVDCKMLTKLALKFSDGVIISDKNIDPEILQFVQESEKVVLDVSDKTEFDAVAYSKYFESLCPKEEKKIEEE